MVNSVQGDVDNQNREFLFFSHYGPDLGLYIRAGEQVA
jgi:hypothetical protein